ncbi:Na/Pi cotransporter family protein [Thiosulfativibrio zosterae]|uniref:Na/Pi cotransporter n=1 Tax=Thiosulfativibrio zosterae TaxID=2675053 RepID=A0A6F8PJR2_9GAMM|nr:Na/Pi cotransporter family protein [Thiosulfativibrio zosterae]BBP42297.1 Na/Pi cotransporter [Thiosulfativibrio zosterae]
MTLNWFEMSMELLGGLAIFLYGLDMMIKGLLAVAGEKMKVFMGKLTTNRVTGAISGAVVTGVIQSSSATTVLVVGFVSAGFITVTQAASIIMGANLGTTMTAQIVAFKVTNLALLMVAFGFLLQFLERSSQQKSIGQLIMGLGLVFFGMNVMGSGMAPLKSFEPFLELMRELQNPFYGILVGFLFTALVQSSSATIGIVIVMASSGLITLPAGIAIAMGADIGTCTTALLAALGKTRDALRTALVHVTFNVMGVLIWLPFLGSLAALAIAISPGDMQGINSISQDVPREIANANTLFKLSALVLFLPMIPLFVWFVNKLVPVIPEESHSKEIKPLFLDESLAGTASLAFGNLKMELANFQTEFAKFFAHVIRYSENTQLSQLAFEDSSLIRLKRYQQAILEYIGKISRSDLDDDQQAYYVKMITLVNTLSIILETIEYNLLKTKHEALSRKLKPSKTMEELMDTLAKEVAKAIDNALLSLQDDQHDKAVLVVTAKPTINHLMEEALTHQAKNFQANEQRMQIFRFEMQIVEGLKTLFFEAKRIAKLNIQENA